jgi:hypothetical protein
MCSETYQHCRMFPGSDLLGGEDTCPAPALCVSLVSEKAFPRPYDVATNIAMNCPNPTSFEEFSNQSVTLDIINEPTVATAKTKSSRP